MAPAATTTTTTSTQSNGVAKTEQKSSGGDVHLTSADVIQLEHEYGAHKYVVVYSATLLFELKS